MPPESDLVKQLSALEVGDIRVSEPLCDHGTWRIGGPADVLVEPHSPDQLSALLKHLSGKPVPVAVIGDGSNLLFDDTGFRGVVVKIAGMMASLEIDGTTVRALSGMSVTRMAHAAGSAGLSGIEHTVGIPGTFGGLLVMNGGSLRKNIGDNVTSVTVMDRAGKERTVPAADCGFSYRSSVFQESDDIVLAGKLELTRRDPKLIRREMLDIIHEREVKFPLLLPNCGSVFSSSVEMFNAVGPPGRLIEEAGLKGTRAGGAQISKRHANFFVNTGGATAEDIKQLIRIARNAVFKRTGYWMSCEVKIVLPDGPIKPAHEDIESE